MDAEFLFSEDFYFGHGCCVIDVKCRRTFLCDNDTVSRCIMGDPMVKQGHICKLKSLFVFSYKQTNNLVCIQNVYIGLYTQCLYWSVYNQHNITWHTQRVKFKHNSVTNNMNAFCTLIHDNITTEKLHINKRTCK